MVRDYLGLARNALGSQGAQYAFAIAMLGISTARQSDRLRKTPGIQTPRGFRQTLRRTFWVPFVVALALAAALILEVRFLTDRAAWVEHTDQVISIAEGIYRTRIDQETGVRAYVLTGDTRFLEPFYAGRQEALLLEPQLRQLISDNPEQTARNEASIVASRAWSLWADQAIAVTKAGRHAGDVEFQLRGKELMDRYRRAGGDFLEHEQRLRDERLARSRRALELVNATIVAVAILFAVGFALLERKHLSSLSLSFDDALKTAETSTADAEAQRDWLHTTVTSIGDAVIATDAAGLVTLMNPVAEKLTEWSLIEAKGKPLADVFRIVNLDTRQAVENPVDKVRRLNKVAGLANHTILISRSGQEITIDDSGAPIFGPDGTLAGVVLVFRDVTSQRKAEAILHARQTELERIIAGTPFMLTRCSRDLRYRFVSQAYAEMLHRHPDEIAGKPIVEIMGEEGLDEIRPHIEKVLRGERTSYEAEIPFQNVGRRVLQVIYTPDRDERGSVVGWIASIVDVTEHRQAEDALHRSEARFSELVERAPFGVYVIDSQFRISHMNASSQTGAFRNVHPVIGRDIGEAMRILWPEDVAAEVIAHFRHTLETGEPYCSPRFTNPRHDVEVVESYEWELHRITLADGQYGVICYYFDSTPLRQAEQAVRESKQHLEQEAEALKKLDESSSRLWQMQSLSSGLEEMLEASIRLLSADKGNVQLLNPETGTLRIAAQKGFDQEFLDFFREVSTDHGTACGRALRSGESTVIEDVEQDAPYAPFREVARKAGYRAVLSCPLIGKEGAPLGILSTHFRQPHRLTGQDLQRFDLFVRRAADFIERCQSEERLRHIQERLWGLINSAMDAVIAVDAEQQIVMFNPAAEKIFGCPASEAIGSPLDRFIPARFRGVHRRHIQNFGQTGVTSRSMWSPGTLWGLRRNGQEFPIEATISQVEVGGQKLFTVILRDITERKQAEETLRSDLDALTRMHDLSSKRLGVEGLKPLLEEVMDAAVAILSADKGTLQMIEGDSLRIVAQHNHERPFLEFFAAAENVASACGEATRRGERTIVEDVENSSIFAGTSSLPVLRQAGVRAVQSTPLLTRSGRLLGILTTHWSLPYVPDEDDLRRLDLLARQAADLIESAQAEQALAEQAGLLELASDAIIVRDEEGRIAYWNKGAEDLYGWSREEVFGEITHNLFRTVFPQPLAGIVNRVREDKHWEGELVHTCKSGEQVTVLSRWMLVHHEQDARGPRSVMEINTDITRSKQLEAALQSNERLALAGRLSASIAHEIHNPLDMVANALFLIEQRIDGQHEIRQLITMAQGEVQRVAEISRNMLSLHRESRTPSKVKLSELLEGVVALIEETIAKGRRKIELVPGYEGEVEGFPSELRQVFTNVIKNAVEATAEGGDIKIYCEPAQESAQDGVLVRVVDNGDGVPEQVQSRLFNPFVTTKEQAGTGLGLWVSRVILEKHGGSIRLNSSDGPEDRSTTVSIFLPLRVGSGKSANLA